MWTRPRFWIGMLLVMGISLASARAAPATRPAGPTEQALGQLVSVKIEEQPLSQAVETLRNATNAQIVVSWNELAKYGITRETPVTLPPLKDLPMRKVLDLILQQVSASLGGVTQLAWTIDEDVITISTRDDLSQRLTTRIYDISELADMLAASRPAGTAAPKQPDFMDSIITTVMENISPTSWAAAGGVATIRSLSGQLIIVQTPFAHDEIEQLLDKLRQSALQASPLFRPVSASFDNMRLPDALKNLADQAQVNLHVNWDSMQVARMNPRDIEVSLNVSQVPLGRALQLVLDSAGSRTARLGYSYADGVLVVASQEHLAEAFSGKSPQERTQEAQAQIVLVDKMKETYFDPAAAGVVAIGAIKAELQRAGQDVAKALEELLAATHSQGLRNALHMTLKDLYQQAGNQPKVMEHLVQMLRENDNVYSSGGKVPESTIVPSAPADRGGGGRGMDPARR